MAIYLSHTDLVGLHKHMQIQMGESLYHFGMMIGDCVARQLFYI